MVEKLSYYKIYIFISHSWTYSNHYDKLAEWIFKLQWKLEDTPINFENRSVPKDDPIHLTNSDAELKNAIFNQIYNSNVVVIPTGMYTNYSKWIQKEIEGANLYQKPILAVNPWGQERKSNIVQNAANQTVGWNKDSVVKEIWRLYRDR